MTLKTVNQILLQAKDLGTCKWIYFEGGEPFLYYSLLINGVRAAAGEGFKVGIVSNGYWATSYEDAIECLRPFKGLVADLSISTDLYHGSELLSQESKVAKKAAQELGIPFDSICIHPPGDAPINASSEGEDIGCFDVRYRGRAAVRLTENKARTQWELLTECPDEDLADPKRVHVDPFGNLHVCQGLLVGNICDRTLAEICGDYDPASHPVVGPLLEGGPAELARACSIVPGDKYADACHLCYETRRITRPNRTDILGPGQVYGEDSLFQE